MQLSEMNGSLRVKMVMAPQQLWSTATFLFIIQYCGYNFFSGNTKRVKRNGMSVDCFLGPTIGFTNRSYNLTIVSSFVRIGSLFFSDILVRSYGTIVAKSCWSPIFVENSFLLRYGPKGPEILYLAFFQKKFICFS